MLSALSQGSFVFPGLDESRFDILNWISNEELKVGFIVPNWQQLHQTIILNFVFNW